MRPAKAADESGREQAHVPGQAHEVDRVLAQEGQELGVVILARPAPVVAEERRDAGLARPLEAGSGLHVRDHDRDPPAEPPRPPRRR